MMMKSLGGTGGWRARISGRAGGGLTPQVGKTMIWHGPGIRGRTSSPPQMRECGRVDVGTWKIYNKALLPRFIKSIN